MIDLVNRYYKGTIPELWIVESQYRVNAGIPSGKTERWAISLEGEEVVVLPRETIDGGVYAMIVALNGWNGFTYEQMTAGVIHPESSNVEFPDPGV